MKRHNSKTYYDFSESLVRLVEIMLKDSRINREVTRMLNLDGYHRRIVLNEWLEGLRKKNAPPDLMRALGCLFDEEIARQILMLINKHKL